MADSAEARAYRVLGNRCFCDDFKAEFSEDDKCSTCQVADEIRAAEAAALERAAAVCDAVAADEDEKDVEWFSTYSGSHINLEGTLNNVAERIRALATEEAKP